jgi:predicted DNA-binding protein (MmcQ/YjbR family)
MDIESFFEFCHTLHPEITEDFPFDSSTLVFRINQKIFAMTNIDNFYGGVNLKCNPERAIELRESFVGIVPGYHTNKKHWNTVYPNSDVPDDLFKELIQHSFELVLVKKKFKP